MSLYQLKSQFQDQLRPISDALVEQKVTANQVTVSAVLLSLGTAYMIAKPAQMSSLDIMVAVTFITVCAYGAQCYRWHDGA